MRNCNLPPVTSGTRAYLSQAPRCLLDVGFRAVALLLLLLPLARATAADTSLEILFSYGSEKKNWVEDVTQRFNAADHKTKSGNVVQVQTLAMGSGKAIERGPQRHPPGLLGQPGFRRVHRAGQCGVPGQGWPGSDGLGNWDLDVKTDQLNWSDEVYRICGLRKGEAVLVLFAG